MLRQSLSASGSKVKQCTAIESENAAVTWSFADKDAQASNLPKQPIRGLPPWQNLSSGR